MPQAVAAAATWVAGLFSTAGTVAYAAAYTATTIAAYAGLQYAVDAVSKPKQKPIGSELQLNIDAAYPREMIVGERRVGGSLVARYSRGSNLYNAHLVIQLADHPCVALNKVYDNGRLVQDAALSHGVRTEITAYSNSGGARVWMTWHDGRPGQSADSDLVTKSAQDPEVVAGKIQGWTSNHKGAGCAYVHVEVQWDSDILTSLPAFTFQVQGAKFYDRRKDTTAGGSGSHRHDDPSTWEYTTNARVVTDHYLLGYQVEDDPLAFGIGLSKSEVPYDDFAAGADLCDEDIETGTGGDVETIKRYVINGVVSCAQYFEDQLEDFQIQMAARIVDLGGRIGILGAEERTSAVSLTSGDLVKGEPLQFAPKLPFSDLYGSVSGTFSDPGNLYEPTPYETQTSAYATLPDGGEAQAVTMDLPLEIHPRRAVRNVSAWLARESLQPRMIAAFGPKAWKLRPGDWFDYTDADLQVEAAMFEVIDIVPNEDFTVLLTARAIDPDFLAFDNDNDPDLSVPPDIDPVDLMLDPPEFDVTETTMSGGGVTIPAITFTLTSDATVGREVVIEYGISPGASPSSTTVVTMHADQIFTQITQGLVIKPYRFRAKMRAGVRESAWTDWSDQVTPPVAYAYPAPGGAVTATPDELNVFAYISDPDVQSAIVERTYTGDVTAEIQDAMDEAADSGRLLVFPDGLYPHTGLTRKPGLWMKGRGWNTELFLKNGSNTHSIATENFATLVGSGSYDGEDGGGIETIQINGNRANNTAGHNLAFYGRRFTIRTVRSIEAPQSHLYGEWGQFGEEGMEATVDGFWGDTSGEHGMHWKGPHDSVIQRVFLVDSGQHANNSYDGFLIEDYGASQFKSIHAWHRSTVTNRMRYPINNKAYGATFEDWHAEGGVRGQFNWSGQYARYDSGRAYASFDGAPNIIVRQPSLAPAAWLGGPAFGEPDCTGVMFGGTEASVTGASGTVAVTNHVTGVTSGAEAQVLAVYSVPGGQELELYGITGTFVAGETLQFDNNVDPPHATRTLSAALQVANSTACEIAIYYAGRGPVFNFALEGGKNKLTAFGAVDGYSVLGDPNDEDEININVWDYITGEHSTLRKLPGNTALGGYLDLRPNNSIAAAGSNQSGATELPDTYSILTVASGSGGVKARASVAGRLGGILANALGSAVNFYPASGEQFLGYGTNAPIALAPYEVVLFACPAGTTWHVLRSPKAAAILAALSPADGNFIVGDGANFTVESGATARTSLGLGTAATQNTGTSGANVPLLNAANTFGDTTKVDKASGGTTQLIVGGNNNQSTVLDIVANSGQSRALRFMTTLTSRRFDFTLNSTAESGANAGSNFVCTAYDDSNASLGSVFSITRSSRVWNFQVAPTFTDAPTTRTNLGLGTAATANTGTSGTTVPLNDGANIWSSGQTFRLATTSGGQNIASVESTDAGALGATWRSYHNSASPANNDEIQRWSWLGNNSTPAGVTFGYLSVVATNVTAAAEAAYVDIRTIQAGTRASRFRIGAGVYHGSVTGGDPGDNAINFGTIKQNNVQVATLSGTEQLSGKSFAQALVSDADNTRNLGTTANRWASVNAAGLVILATGPFLDIRQSSGATGEKNSRIDKGSAVTRLLHFDDTFSNSSVAWEAWQSGYISTAFNIPNGYLRMGGQPVVDPSRGIVFRGYTSANIASVAHAVNTTDKAEGKAVYDQTNDRLMIATGGAAADPWKSADGGTSVTPS